MSYGASGGTPMGDPRQMVSGPAIGLMVTGGIDIAIGILDFVFRIVGVGLLAQQAGNDPQQQAQLAGGVIGFFWDILIIGAGVLVIMGAIKMKNLQSHGLAMAASITALVPCVSCCFLAGIPFGIWSLKPEVKSAFTQ